MGTEDGFLDAQSESFKTGIEEEEKSWSEGGIGLWPNLYYQGVSVLWRLLYNFLSRSFSSYTKKTPCSSWEDFFMFSNSSPLPQVGEFLVKNVCSRFRNTIQWWIEEKNHLLDIFRRLVRQLWGLWNSFLASQGWSLHKAGMRTTWCYYEHMDRI